QYSLPILFWLGLLAAFGVQQTKKHFLIPAHRIILLSLVLLHNGVAAWAVLDLKADRFPHYGDLVKAQALLPPRARVIQVSASYGATPTYALSRPTIAYDGEGEAPLRSLHFYRRLGYSHLLFFDYSLRGHPLHRERTWINGTE